MFNISLVDLSMRVLITGGAGFIGSHIADQFAKAGHELAVLDNFSTGKRHQVHRDSKLYEGDLLDLTFLQASLKDFQPDLISHQAAHIFVTQSVEKPQHDLEINAIGTINLLEANKSLKNPAKLVYGTSGGAMYGAATNGALTEDSAIAPLSPYGLSKYVGETYVWLYRRLYQLPATVLRYANVYGPRQDPHGEAGVFAIFSERMHRHEQVVIFGDGSATRDYVYVEDVARANLLAATQAEGEACNIGTGISTSTQQVFESLKTEFNYQLDPIYKPLRPGELQDSKLAITKAKAVLNWKPEVKLSEGCRLTANWYQTANTAPNAE